MNQQSGHGTLHRQRDSSGTARHGRVSVLGIRLRICNRVRGRGEGYKGRVGIGQVLPKERGLGNPAAG